AATSFAPLPMVHAAGSDLLKVAVIGSGGRGTGAAIDCVKAGGNVKIVAVADAFEERARAAADQIAKQCGAKADLPPDRIFVGLDAYQKAIDCGVDMVIIAGPPGFRPQHYEAAVKAGKHVFMEKPVCVCPGGYRKIMAANKVAEEKNLKIAVGLMHRHEAPYQSGIKAIQEGRYGDVTMLRIYYNIGSLWNRPRRPGMTEMQYQVNNWYHFVWLSGDHIVEQHVHGLNIANWVMSAVLDKHGPDWPHPIDANGMGASQTRGYNGKEVQGQIFDAHFVEYNYSNGVKLFSQCRQQPNTWCPAIHESFHSTLQPLGHSIPGNDPAVELKFSNPYVQEHYRFQQAIQNNEKYNEGWYGAIDSMTAVLGRMATYSGRLVKWDELVEKGLDTFPAELSWDATPPVLPDSNGFYPIPTPGRYDPYSPA
ncbi:MAG: Gfo/Idh/MocA family oxidoreductase, partial [Candidatus Omnitrophica bacterium]|nr:Gfo/Idh/MocA family oxidoreductase [Candidatus Omnitrophota bacterium]